MELAVPATVAFGLLSFVVAALLAALLIYGKYGCPCKCRCYCHWYKERKRRSILVSTCRKVHFSSDVGDPICSNERCPLCLEDFTNKDRIRVTPCTHGFHEDCLVQCLTNSPNCPLCKAAVLETQTEYAPLLQPT